MLSSLRTPDTLGLGKRVCRKQSVQTQQLAPADDISDAQSHVGQIYETIEKIRTGNALLTEAQYDDAYQEEATKRTAEAEEKKHTEEKETRRAAEAWKKKQAEEEETRRAAEEQAAEESALKAPGNPAHWTDMDDPYTAEMFDVPLGSVEYQQVAERVDPSIEIVGVQRVQNKGTRDQYNQRKKMMDHRKDESRRSNERFLFHGTAKSNIALINQHGFDRSYSRKCTYGRGTYFAKNSKYSADDQFAQPDRDGLQHMYLARVVVGACCVGRHKMPTPALVAGSATEMHDSTVDSVEDPNIFVAYHDAQAYPEYLITFKRARANCAPVSAFKGRSFSRFCANNGDFLQVGGGANQARMVQMANGNSVGSSVDTANGSSVGSSAHVHPPPVDPAIAKLHKKMVRNAEALMDQRYHVLPPAPKPQELPPSKIQRRS